MSLRKQGVLLPLAQFMDWTGLKELPAQDPEWLAGEDHHPVGQGDDGNPVTLDVDIGQDSKLFISQDDPFSPFVHIRLIFNGYANGGVNPPDVLVESITYPNGCGFSDNIIGNPSEEQVKALCQGFYLALTNQTPIGTDANPLGRIRSGAAAVDLDARMAAAQQSSNPYANAWNVTKGMFS